MKFIESIKSVFSKPESKRVTAADMSGFSFEPFVKSDAGQRFQDLIEREQLPGDVKSALEGALMGDMTRQSLLFQAMIDTWPRLQKALGEVKRAVRRSPWEIKPYLERGQEEASTSAIERAEFVEDSIWHTSPRAAWNELSTEGMLESLVYGYFAGHHVLEIHWERKDGYIKPKAFKDVPPRFYGYPYKSTEEDRLMFDRNGTANGYTFEDFPENRFLVAINKGHPGHPSIAAPMRALTQYWLAANFGLKWLLQFSQLYGIPFRWATYDDESSKSKVCAMLDNVGSQGWAAFPSGTEMQFVETTRSADSIPQKLLIEMADKQVEIFILGQSLTSDVGDSGSRALGDVHEGVRQEVLEGVAEYCGNIVNRQLIPAIIKLNYGDTMELPCLEAEYEQPKDEKSMAERDEIILRSGIELPKKWYYKRHGVPMPENGEEVLVEKEETPEKKIQPPVQNTVTEEEMEEVQARIARVQARAATEEEKELIEDFRDAVKKGLVNWESIESLLESEVNKGGKMEV